LQLERINVYYNEAHGIFLFCWELWGIIALVARLVKLTLGSLFCPALCLW